jgi:hypothetical protein
VNDPASTKGSISWALGTVTGSTATDPMSTTTRVVSYPFDKYEIKILVSPSNQFIGIQEVSLRKDFRSYEQRAAGNRVHEVDEFYKE